MVEDPLKDWRKTTLWFKIRIDPQQIFIEFDVWHPPGGARKKNVYVFWKNKLIRRLTGTEEMIIQGQYYTEKKT